MVANIHTEEFKVGSIGIEVVISIEVAIGMDQS